MEVQHKLVGIGHSCFPRSLLPNKILVGAQVKSYSWGDAQGKPTHLCKIDRVHLSSTPWVHMGVFRLDVPGQFLMAPYVIQSMRYVEITHFLSHSTLLFKRLCVNLICFNYEILS
jgi:hypothetical protein